MHPFMAHENQCSTGGEGEYSQLWNATQISEHHPCIHLWPMKIPVCIIISTWVHTHTYSWAQTHWQEHFHGGDEKIRWGRLESHFQLVRGSMWSPDSMCSTTHAGHEIDALDLDQYSPPDLTWALQNGTVWSNSDTFKGESKMNGNKSIFCSWGTHLTCAFLSVRPASGKSIERTVDARVSFTQAVMLLS